MTAQQCLKAPNRHRDWKRDTGVLTEHIISEDNNKHSHQNHSALPAASAGQMRDTLRGGRFYPSYFPLPAILTEPHKGWTLPLNHQKHKTGCTFNQIKARRLTCGFLRASAPTALHSTVSIAPLPLYKRYMLELNAGTCP